MDNSDCKISFTSFENHGLNERVGILWITAVIFGLAYGGVVIVGEARNGELTKEEMEGLHLFIGINHAMIEEESYKKFF